VRGQRDAVGNVSQDAGGADQLAVGSFQPVHARFGPALLARGRVEAELIVDRVEQAELQSFESLQEIGAIRGDDGAEERRADRLFDHMAGQLFPGRVEEGPSTIDVGAENDIGDDVHDPTELRLAFLQFPAKAVAFSQDRRDRQRREEDRHQEQLNQRQFGAHSSMDECERAGAERAPRRAGRHHDQRRQHSADATHPEGREQHNRRDQECDGTGILKENEPADEQDQAERKCTVQNPAATWPGTRSHRLTADQQQRHNN